MIKFDKKVIFYFDKDVLSLELMRNTLDTFYTFRGFTSRTALINTVRNSELPYVILLHIDSNVPSSSRLVATIRHESKEIPLIAVISHETDTMYKDLFEMNFYDTIFKPFNRNKILKKINQVIREYKFINNADSEQYLIHTFANLEELRDKNTLGHNNRVGLISYEIAKHIGCNSVCQKLIRYAAMLHDIGKHGIPENILNKPEKLTNKEFDIIKSHPHLGYQILAPILNTNIESLTMASEITLKHHEKLDGSGYPNNLKAIDIPMYVRIVTVVDMFDAISSKRPYHDEMCFSDTLNIIDIDVKNDKVDSAIFNALHKLKDNIKDIVKHQSRQSIKFENPTIIESQIPQCLNCYERNL